MDRAIDHLVLAGRDLENLADVYRRLGFIVGARNRHPWGTENHIVQFDGTFLELIGVAPDFRRLLPTEDAAPFANTLADYLAQRDGLALVALRSHDAEGDARTFAAAGIGFGNPLHFSRTAEAKDGTRREVAFSTAFTCDPSAKAPEFFVCQHHRPENFWNPGVQAHPNGAQNLLGLVMVAPRPQDRLKFLSKLFDPDAVDENDRGVRVRAGAHRTDVITSEAFQTEYGSDHDLAAPFAAYRVGVASIDSVRRLLDAAGIDYTLIGGRLVVPASGTRGVSLSFEVPT